MNKACLVTAHHAGLFSLLNNLIMWLDEYEHVAVDWSNCLYGPTTFTELFEPLSPLPDGPFDTVGVHPSQWLTYLNAGHLYQGDSYWRKDCNLLWQRLKPLRRVTGFCDWFTEEYFTKIPVIAVLIRAHPSAGEQLTGRSQTLDEYVAAIESELRGSDRRQVYIASSDEQSLSWFRERFNVVYHPVARRANTRDYDFHLQVPQTWTDALNALQEVLIMSRADVLIHGVSNMATAALYIRPELRSKYLP